jgi:hypothetical protein
LSGNQQDDNDEEGHIMFPRRTAVLAQRELRRRAITLLTRASSLAAGLAMAPQRLGMASRSYRRPLKSGVPSYTKGTGCLERLLLTGGPATPGARRPAVSAPTSPRRVAGLRRTSGNSGVVPRRRAGRDRPAAARRSCPGSLGRTRPRPFRRSERTTLRASDARAGGRSGRHHPGPARSSSSAARACGCR